MVPKPELVTLQVVDVEPVRAPIEAMVKKAPTRAQGASSPKSIKSKVSRLRMPEHDPQWASCKHLFK